MRVLFCHTDYRLYWPARLQAARSFLGGKGIDIRIVEIAGKGSPYAFAGSSEPGALSDCWECLFPGKRMESLSPNQAAESVWGSLERHQPDVVFAGAIAFPSGAVAVRWANVRGRRVVICDNARALDVPRNKLVNAVKCRIYSHVHAVLIPAPSHVPDYTGWGISRESMFFGLNVIDNDFFRDRAEQARRAAPEIRERLSLPRRYLLAVGRQVEKKNLGGLISSWIQFKSLCPASDLKLVLVGEGPERPALMKRAGTSPSQDIIFRDFLAAEVLAQYYGLASALVLPSMHGETWGLVVNEAMAAGLPVLVSKECGCAETLVRETENGWSFRANDTETITRAILRLDSCSRDRLAGMGRCSQEIISDWGLDRFCDGVWQATNYAIRRPAKKLNPIDWMILRAWNGRYRPV